MEKDLVTEAKKLDQQMTKMLGEKYHGITLKGTKERIERISSGIYSLDQVLGGGIPLGRIIEIFGPESTAKSGLLQQICGEFQREGKLVAYLDVENALDPTFAECLGFETEKAAIVDQLENLEEVLESTRTLVKSGCISLLGIDSICGISPAGNQERKVGEETMALAARLISRHLPEIAKEAAKNKCTVILINQVRSSLSMYGSPTTTPGGNAIKFTASIRLKTSRKDIIKAGKRETGILLNIKGEKNKCGVPFVSREIRFLFPHVGSNGQTVAGVDKVADLVGAGVEEGVIVRSGSWYSYRDYKAQGEENLSQMLSKESLIQLREDINNVRQSGESNGSETESAQSSEESEYV